MKKPNRISMSLFDDELKGLINASAKIFPITQDDVDNNLNPNGYEYGRIGRQIYMWKDGHWGYIIADDVDIDWEDIRNKPTNYKPSTHMHTESDIEDLDKYTQAEVDSKLESKANRGELHEHGNKTLLDIITQALLDKWNAAYNHILDTVKHITDTERNLWNTVAYKANKDYVDSELDNKADLELLDGKSNINHNHDGAYYKKSEVDSKLSSKSNTGHTHTELDIHINDDIVHISPQDRERWDNHSPFKYEQEFLELRDHYGYMNINGGDFDGNDGYYLMIDGGGF